MSSPVGPLHIQQYDVDGDHSKTNFTFRWIWFRTSQKAHNSRFYQSMQHRPLMFQYVSDSSSSSAAEKGLFQRRHNRRVNHIPSRMDEERTPFGMVYRRWIHRFLHQRALWCSIDHGCSSNTHDSSILSATDPSKENQHHPCTCSWRLQNAQARSCRKNPQERRDMAGRILPQAIGAVLLGSKTARNRKRLAFDEHSTSRRLQTVAGREDRKG